jgi:hypothetical protein
MDLAAEKGKRKLENNQFVLTVLPSHVVLHDTSLRFDCDRGVWLKSGHHELAPIVSVEREELMTTLQI